MKASSWLKVNFCDETLLVAKHKLLQQNLNLWQTTTFLPDDFL